METRRRLFSSLGSLTATGVVAAIATDSTTNRAQAQASNKDGKCQPPLHYRYSYITYLHNPCANEFVRITVDVKYMLHICTDLDGTIRFKVHTQTHGTGHGIDLTTDTPTGTNYIVNGQDRVRQILGPPGGGSCTPVTSSETYRTRLIGKGAPPNAVLTITSTFSVDESCNATFNNTFGTDCRG
jgi:hypothetical protein